MENKHLLIDLQRDASIPKILLRAAENDQSSLNTLIQDSQTWSATLPNTGENAVHIAVKFKSYEILGKLIQLGFSLEHQNNKGETPLTLAALMGELRSLRVLVVEGKAEVNYTYLSKDSGQLCSPLLNAIQAKSKGCIQFLVQHGARYFYPDHIDESPIFKVIHTQDKHLVEGLLLSIKGDASEVSRLQNSDGLSILHSAVKYGTSDILEYLARHSLYFGFDLDEEDPEGYTLLMKVLFIKRDFEIAEKLIQYGADIDKRTQNGNTVRQMAKIQNAIDIMVFSDKHSKTSIANEAIEDGKEIDQKFNKREDQGGDILKTLGQDYSRYHIPRLHITLEEKLRKLQTHIPDFTSIPNPFLYKPIPNLKFLDPMKHPQQSQNTLNDSVLLEIDHLLYQSKLDKSLKDPHIAETIQQEANINRDIRSSLRNQRQQALLASRLKEVQIKETLLEKINDERFSKQNELIKKLNQLNQNRSQPANNQLQIAVTQFEWAQADRDREASRLQNRYKSTFVQCINRLNMNRERQPLPQFIFMENIIQPFSKIPFYLIICQLRHSINLEIACNRNSERIEQWKSKGSVII